MKTTLYQASELNQFHVQQHIKSVLEQDGLVVFPTETVYGIGANALKDEAVKAIYHAKGRPSDNPLIVHVSKTEDIYQYAINIPKIADTLIKAFMPGPLTLVLHKHPSLSTRVTGGLGTVAIRVPNHPVALKVIEISGLPICAPSANLSGRPSSTNVEHVLQDFDGKVDIIIDGGNTEIGLESTVLDLTTDIPTLLRPGKISLQMIESVLSMKILDASESKISDIPKSPGMKYKHYAPKGKLSIVRGEFLDVINYLKSQLQINPEIGIICPTEYTKQITSKHLFDLGSLHQIDEIGAHIFAALRHMDQLNIQEIFIPYLPTEGFGNAIMNRLIKASNHQIIEV
jgi:L-threonylcarbamoyladenylate synthase